MGDWWNALPFVGSAIDAAVQPGRDKKAREFQRQMWVRQRNYNTEVLKNQLQWRMDDARRSGIHPLAALGVNPASGPSMSVGDTGGGGPDFGSIGQDLSRAISAQSTQDERDSKIKDLQIESLQADNASKHIANATAASQLQKLQQVGPPFPGSTSFIPGQGNSGQVRVVPNEVPSHQSAASADEIAGQTPDVAFSRTGKGLYPVIPEKMAEQYESDFQGYLAWVARNRLTPMLGSGSKYSTPDKSRLPKGYTDWRWSSLYGWIPTKRKAQNERNFTKKMRGF